MNDHAHNYAKLVTANQSSPPGSPASPAPPDGLSSALKCVAGEVDIALGRSSDLLGILGITYPEKGDSPIASEGGPAGYLRSLACQLSLVNERLGRTLSHLNS